MSRQKIQSKTGVITMLPIQTVQPAIVPEKLPELPIVVNEVPAVATSKSADPVALFEEEYFQTQFKNGTDYTMKGGWQKMYAYYLNRIFELKGKKVVDLGCAMGANTSAFADHGAEAIGVDISHYACEKTPHKNFKFICSDACECSEHIEENSVDFVHSMFMINYIPEEKSEQLFQQIKKICKNDALVFLILNLSGAKTINGNEIAQPKWFWDSIAGKLEMVDGTRGIYEKLMNTHVPGWAFMPKYRWPYLLYKVIKK